MSSSLTHTTESQSSIAGPLTIPLREIGDTNSPESWNELAPETLTQACDRLEAAYKFYAVVVDEGQDHRDLWWKNLESTFRGPEHKDCNCVFYDPTQNLFVANPSMPAELRRPYELVENCRNVVRSAAYCAALMGYETRFRDRVPCEDELEIVQARAVVKEFREAGRRVGVLRTPNPRGLKMSQVTVTAPGRTDIDTTRLLWRYKDHVWLID